MNTFIDVDYSQECKAGQMVGGDVFHSQKVREENRTIAVLSDGLGSGIKAGVLATLTATMAARFIRSYKDIRRTAEIIMETLPVCSVRRINYSTFTIVDVAADLETRIIEYDNPPCLVVRGGRVLEMEKHEVTVKGGRTGHDAPVRYASFQAEPGDRIVLFSDGVTQSGMGGRGFPLGWGEENARDYVLGHLAAMPEVASRELARLVTARACNNDAGRAKDDTTCAVIHFRVPRDLLVVSGPPIDRERDRDLADLVRGFTGKKIICGGTTANIVARELQRHLMVDITAVDPEIPPPSRMDGIDLVTEGILTLGRVAELLEEGDGPETVRRTGRENAADRLVTMLLGGDRIRFLVGTKINEAHQDPHIPVELEIRRNVVKKIARLLEEKYLKDVGIKFI